MTGKQRTLIDIASLRLQLPALQEELKKLLPLKGTYIVYGSRPDEVGSGRYTRHIFYGYKFNRLNQLKASARGYSRQDVMRQLLFKTRTTQIDLDVRLLQLRIDNIKQTLGVR